MKSYLKFALLCAHLFVMNAAIGQAIISYPSLAEGLSVCQDESTLTVKVAITDDAADGVTIAINLPPGIVYQTGTVSTLSSNNGLTVIESNVTDLNNPIFVINPKDLFSGDEVVFTIERIADCNALASAQAGNFFKDSIFITTPVGNISEVNPITNSYDVLFASMSLLSPPAVTGAVNSTHNRDVKIQNGGFGCLEEVTFFVVNTGNTHNSLMAGPDLLTPSSTNGDTTFYTLGASEIDNFGNNDDCFENGEEIVLTENFTITSCPASTNYGAAWGCSAEYCQIQVKNGQINIASGVPNISTTEKLISGGSACTNAIVEVTYTNNGSGAGDAYGLVFKYGTGYSTTVLYQSDEHFTNFSINGTTMTDTLVNGYGVGINSPHYINTAELGTDPDAAGSGLEDLDGDGQFDDLGVGETVVVRFEVIYACKTSCPTYHDYQRNQTQICYKDQCDNVVETVIRSNSNALQYYGGSDGTTAAGPTDVVDNETISFEVCQSYRIGVNYGKGLTCPTDTVSLQMILPSGITYAGNPLFDGNPGTGSTSGDTVWVSGKLNKLGALSVCFSIDLTFSCASWDGSALNIPTNVVYNCDDACVCIENWGCETLTLVPHCPGCIDGGLTTNAAWSERLTMGYADPSGTTRADPALLPEQNLKTAMPCDTVRIHATSRQIGITEYGNAHMEMKYTMPGGNEVLDVLGGTVDIIDVSTGLTYTCEMPPVVKTTVADTVYHDWDFTSLIGDPACGLPAGFMFAQNDSVNVHIDVKILKNSALECVPVGTLSNLRFKHYNLDGANVEKYCDTWGAELYLHNTCYGQWAGSAVTNNGCNSYQNWISYRFRHGSTDIYPQEIRPYATVDSFVIILNTGDVYDATVPPQLWSRGTPLDGYPGEEIVTFLPPPTIVGNKLIWANDGTWPLGDMRVYEHSAYMLYFNLISGCASTTGNNQLKTYFTDYGESADASCHDAMLLSSNRYVTNRQPDLEITDLTGCISATKPIESWDIEIRNTSGGLAAEYMWVAFEDLASGVNVLNVYDLTNGGAVLPTTSYADGQWIQLDNNFAGGGTRQLRVEFEYSSCAVDTLPVIASYDCPGYPVDPTEAPCEPVTQYLEVKPQLAEVQINRTQWPVGAQPLCDTMLYEVEINSAQLSFLTDPTLDIVLPSGMTLLPDPMVEYPGGSGNWEPIASTTLGSTETVDLTGHTGISADGVPGTQDALNPAERNVKIRMEFITNCDFFAGSRFQFIARGNSPCEDPAIGSGITSVTPPLNIVGITPPYATIVGMAISDTIQACTDGQKVDFNVLFSGGSTTGGDTAYITLPSGILYDPGSYACAPATPPAACPVFADAVTDAGGITIVRLAYPAGIADGTQVDFSIDVLAGPTSSCTAPKTILLENVLSVAGPACPTAPGGFCPQLGVVTGSEAIALELEKPIIDMTEMCGPYTDDGLGNHNYFLSGKIVNSGSDLPAADTIHVEIYCADASGDPIGMPIGMIHVGGPIANGETIEWVDTISGSCDPTNGVVAMIEPVGQMGDENCMCNTLSSMVCRNLVLPVGCTVFAAESTTNGVKLTWTTETETNNAGFWVERSSDARNFERLKWIEGKINSTVQVDYEILDESAIEGNAYYYRLTQQDLDGKETYVCEMIGINQQTKPGVLFSEVYPNPTTGAINVRSFISEESNVVDIQVFSALGELVAELSRGVVQGFNEFEIDLQSQAAGVYIIRLSDQEGYRFEHRVMKANQ